MTQSHYIVAAASQTGVKRLKRNGNPGVVYSSGALSWTPSCGSAVLPLSGRIFEAVE